MLQDKEDRLIARCWNVTDSFRDIIGLLQHISSSYSISSADSFRPEHLLQDELDLLISDGKNLVSSTDTWRLRMQALFQSFNNAAKITETPTMTSDYGVADSIRRLSSGYETVQKIEDRWEDKEGYLLALAEKAKMKFEAVADYFVKPEVFERRMNRLLFTHYFDTNENVRETARRLRLKPASVRVNLSRFRLSASGKYLERYVSESLDKEGLSYERNRDNALKFAVEYKGRKFGIDSVVLSAVDRDKTFKSTPTNVRNSIVRTAQELDLTRPELTGYAGTAAVFMATGGEPFLLTYRQISKLNEDYGDYLWRNPVEDLQILATEDKTLLPALDFRSLLENAS